MKRNSSFAGAVTLAVVFLFVGISVSAQLPRSVTAPKAAQVSPNPVDPCCAITAFNANTGAVTAKENATGRTLTFRIASVEPINEAKLTQTFKVGSKLGYQPLDGGVLKAGSRVRLTVPGFSPLDGVVEASPNPGDPCCAITAFNANTGAVTAKENATGRTLTFRIASAEPINEAKLTQTFKVGSKLSYQALDRGVLKAGSKVRLTVPGFSPLDGVVDASPDPGDPCCGITAFNARTGEVTAKENATGRTLTFKIASFDPDNGAKLTQTFKVGSKLSYQSLDRGVLKAGSRVRLTVPGFDPTNGVVGQIAAR